MSKGGREWAGRDVSTWQWALIAIAVAGLAVDAFVHFHLAATFDPIRTSTLSQGDLFRVEGVLAVIAALALLVRPRPHTAAFALVVAAGGLAAVLIYQYVNVGQIGPFPNMYDPLWSTAKLVSAVGEGLAAVAAVPLVIVLRGPIRAGHGVAAGGSPRATALR